MPGRLEWQHVEVDGRPAAYGVGGAGPPLVFVHGWGLSGRAYRAALKRLVARGLRVWAPTLPPNEAGGLAGYACWLDAFCDRDQLVDVEFAHAITLGAFGAGPLGPARYSAGYPPPDARSWLRMLVAVPHTRLWSDVRSNAQVTRSARR